MLKNFILGIFILAMFCIISSNQLISDTSGNIPLKAARTELDRMMKELKDRKPAPYYISYRITELENTKILSSFGKIETVSTDTSRNLDIDMRVGNYNFDNTHIIRGNPFNFSSSKSSCSLPIQDSLEALRVAIWNASDRAYKAATERYEKAVTNKAVKVKEEDSSADFSHEEASKFYGEKQKFNVNLINWENRLRKLSDNFSKYPWIYDCSVIFMGEVITKYFISTEGTEIIESEPAYRIYINAKTKAEDGMVLPLYKSYFSRTLEHLPDDITLEEQVNNIINTLDGMRKAPLAVTYSGPAILSGEAGGVFFHEIFGHRIEGHRLKDPQSSQTFKNMVGKSVLPDFFNVNLDPTRKEIGGTELAGYYIYDDEGTKAQNVSVVNHGLLNDFLMSRSPIEKFSHSNGHGRAQAGYKPVSRQSNLIVHSFETVSKEKLRKHLINECKKQDKEYGLYFEKVQGGFTFTGTSIPNSFNVNPLVVYKIYVDGRPDELVRGVDLIGTPLTTFSNIIETADDIGVFNGTCGAESGGVPVSAVCPSLLVSKIEVQRKSKSQAKPPILSAPDDIMKP